MPPRKRAPAKGSTTEVRLYKQSDAAWARSFLEQYSRMPTTAPTVANAFYMLTDHIVRLEQYIKLVDPATEGAKRDLPPFICSVPTPKARKR